MLDATSGSTLLDVGCGTGWFTRAFHAAGVVVTGLDVNNDLLDFARKRSAASVQFVRGDARRLPFQDSAFDHVIAVTSLCFVHDWMGTVGEVARVSRRRFAIGLLNRRSLLWRQKGRGGTQGSYAGARWDDAQTVHRDLAKLQLAEVDVRTAVFLPSGSVLARVVERVLPNQLPYGGFLAVAGRREPD
jgi:SAM-dependent methyltransferase